MEGLDSDEFGPMMQADFYPHDNTELEMLKHRQHELLEEKRIAEAEFGQQRAKFMDIFKQKEDNLQWTREQLSVVQSRCTDQESELLDLRHQIQQLSSEMNDIKTAAAIAEVNRMDEMEKLQRKYQEEMASLHSIIKELTNQAELSTAAHYEQEIAKLVRQKEKLETELQETKSKLNRDRDGILASLTKTLQKRVGNADPRENDEENLEYSMKKAQEDTEKLRTLIAPFEDEISSLKSQLKHCQEHVACLESQDLKNLKEAAIQRHSFSNQSTLNGESQALPDDAVASSSGGVIRENSSVKQEGIKFVRRQDWDALHRQLTKLSLEQTNRQCVECETQKAEIKRLQDNEKLLNDYISSLKHLLENENQTRQQLEKYKESLETSLNVVAIEARKQISTLVNRVGDSEKFLEGAKKRFSENKRQLQEQMNVMTTYREDLQAELTRLQKENDEIFSTHSRFAQELQEDLLNFPSTAEDTQALLLKFREEVITAKVARQHAENKLQRELESARSQLQQRSTKERNLAQEVNQLREELAIRNSLYSELEQRIRESEAIDNIASLQAELNNCKMAKANLERNMQQRNSRIEALKKELTNSEAVQKDFVQFSQTLQIELDKFQLREREVRWQHPDDIAECGSCQKSFDSDASIKEHCRHCGHIFCEDCLTQSFPSGPNCRLVVVCRICYQNLIKAQVNGVDCPSTL